ncbi:hypothetical protein [Magnetovirga frankeli]|uniref:hypothetical protein n=1 Tax=Magnetovirga frankeli TaxID=947516 RepID=UPI003D33284D
MSQTKREQINAKIDEHHLLMEEIIGGMDIMLTRMDQRLTRIEEVLGMSDQKEAHSLTAAMEDMRTQLHNLKNAMDQGFELAFRQINKGSANQ